MSTTHRRCAHKVSAELLNESRMDCFLSRVESGRSELRKLKLGEKLSDPVFVPKLSLWPAARGLVLCMTSVPLNVEVNGTEMSWLVVCNPYFFESPNQTYSKKLNASTHDPAVHTYRTKKLYWCSHHLQDEVIIAVSCTHATAFLASYVNILVYSIDELR